MINFVFNFTIGVFSWNDLIINSEIDSSQDLNIFLVVV